MVQCVVPFKVKHLLLLVCRVVYARCGGERCKLARDAFSYLSSRAIRLFSPFLLRQNRLQNKLFVTSMALNFVLWFIMLSVPVSGLPSKPGTGESSNTKSCYLCLAIRKSAPTANKALAALPSDIQHSTLTACASFTSTSLRDFVFPCPMEYVKCFQQINSANSTGSCSMLSMNNCKTKAKIRICHCPGEFCNFIRSDRSSPDSELSAPSSKIWHKEETDDEDLLGPNYPHIPLDIFNQEEMQGDSGSGERPPGVIRIETTAAKPTLVPNLRVDSRATITPATNTASSFSVLGVILSFATFCYIWLTDAFAPAPNFSYVCDNL